jgi:hypothetical protein
VNEVNEQKRGLIRYVGNINQICGIKEYVLKGGKANGIRALDVRNGTGLEYTVLPDRGFDIGNLSFNGLNCSYLSKTGIVVPGYYSESGKSFFRGFYGGFLTTCGLRNVGTACREDGESFDMHGHVTHIPTEEVCASTDWNDGKPEFTLTGKIRESAFFGENLLLERKIISRYGDNRIFIQNTIENQGFRAEVVMFLLHFNLGYPLLDVSSEFLASSGKVVPRDADAAKGISEYAKMQPPTADYAEQVFYHDLNADPDGNTCVALINTQLELGLSLCFNRSQFFNFTQWKQMGEGEYVLGMEPCNCYVSGRTDPQNKEIRTFLQPGEKLYFDVTAEIYSGAAQLKALKNKIKGL